MYSDAEVDPPPSPRFQNSWIDRLDGWIDQLPGSAGSWFLVLALALMLVLLPGAESSEQRRVFVLLSVWAVIPLAAIRHLDRLAAQAIERLRPALDIDAASLAAIRQDFATMPARPLLLANLLGMVSLIPVLRFSPEVFEPFLLAGWRQPVIWGLLYLNFGLLGALVYHSVRQLALVSHAYAQVTQIDVSQLAPLYALAGLAGRTALIWTAALTASVLAAPRILSSHGLATVMFAGMALLAMAAAILPLLGVHRRLVDHKNELLAEADRHVQATIRAIYACAESEDAAGVEMHSKILAQLRAARAVQDGIATWPWQPGSPRALFSALMLPILISLGQRGLDLLLKR
jgi:hypothetical protein